MLEFRGILGGFNVNVNVSLNYQEIGNSYNVTVHEEGSAYNSTVNMKETLTGGYYYLLSYVNNTLSIDYFSSNYSGVFALYPFYLPYHFKNDSTIQLVIKVFNQSKVVTEEYTQAEITYEGDNMVVKYVDYNLTAIPIYYVSAYLVYHNGILHYVDYNYTTSAEIFEETTLSLSSSDTMPIIPILIVLVLAVAVFIAFKKYRLKNV